MIKKINNNKKIIFGVLVLVALIAFTICELSRILAFNGLNSGIVYGYSALAVIFLAVLAVLYIFSVKKEIPIHYVFLITSLVLAGAYLFIFPPFTVPDEKTHFLSSYHFSHLFLFKPSQLFSDQLIIRQIDLDYINASTTRLSPEIYTNTFSSFSMFAADTSTTTISGSMHMSAPLAYLGSGLGLAIARLIHLQPVPAILLGRFLNAVLCIVLAFFAIKIAPYGKMAIVAICSFPMTLHLFSSYSYDGVILSLAILLVAKILSIKENEKSATIKDIIVLLLLIFALAPMKIVYFPLAFMVFIIPKEKFGLNTKKSFWLKTGICAFSVISLLAFQAVNIFTRISSSDTTSYTGALSYSTSWVLSNIKETIKIFFTTFENKGDWYIGTFFGYSLGWFQIYIPLFLYLPVIILTIYAFNKRKGEPEALKFSGKIWSFVLAIGIGLMVMYTLLVSHTPMGSPVIEGVQGRYFLPVAMLIYLVIRSDKIEVSPRFDKYLILAFFAQNYVILTEFFKRIMIQ